MISDLVSTDGAQDAPLSDRSMLVLQYAIATVAFAAAVLLAGLR